MVISNGSGTYSAGGVRVTTQKLIDQPGALVTTDNSTDLAVRGRGFLPVTTGAAVDSGDGEFPLFMTTTGSFRTDSEGYLRTSTGVTLLGWPANADGTIPSFPRDTGAGLQPGPRQREPVHIGNRPRASRWGSICLVRTPTRMRDGTARTLSVEYFDNLGTSQSIKRHVHADGASRAAGLQYMDHDDDGQRLGRVHGRRIYHCFRRFAGSRGHDRDSHAGARGARRAPMTP